MCAGNMDNRGMKIPHQPFDIPDLAAQGELRAIAKLDQCRTRDDVLPLTTEKSLYGRASAFRGPDTADSSNGEGFSLAFELTDYLIVAHLHLVARCVSKVKKNCHSLATSLVDTDDDSVFVPDAKRPIASRRRVPDFVPDPVVGI